MGVAAAAAAALSATTQLYKSVQQSSKLAFITDKSLLPTIKHI
jgi:hypothetical protein